MSEINASDISDDTVILRVAEGWRLYASPLRVVCAVESSEVLPALAELERQRCLGHYLAGFVSYDAAQGIDSSLEVRGGADIPLLWLGVYESYTPLAQLPECCGSDYFLSPSQNQPEYDEYASWFAAVRGELEEGNTYQVNLTYQREHKFYGSEYALFCRLYSEQPTEYAAYIQTGGFAVASVSPELFFEKCRGEVVSKPMKGTRRIVEGRAEQLRAELVSSEKDIAENVMIVDMIRNDLGRVALAGTVEVPQLFSVEEHKTVLQMTSTVTARVECSAVEVLKNIFPCASITGAPKASSMQVISRIETQARGLYTGCIGVIEPCGDGRFNVAIRTAVIEREKGLLSYGVGGGLVWDSQAQAEYTESCDKAAVLENTRQSFELLETILYSGSRFRFLRHHLERLEKSAQYFGFVYDSEQVMAKLREAVSGKSGGALRLRLLLAEDGVVSCEAVEFNQGERRVWLLGLARSAIDASNPYLLNKTTRREIYTRHKSEAAQVDDVLLYNPQGHITETTIANIIYLYQGRWYTPPVDDGLLAGTARAALLERGHVSERSLHLDELETIDDLLLLNSVRGLIRAELV